MIDGAGDRGDRNAGERGYAADVDLGGRGYVTGLAGSFHGEGDLWFWGSAYASMELEAN